MLLGPALLLTTALIWGAAFLAQKLGADHVGPFAFTVARNVLAAAFLGGMLAVRRARRGGKVFGRNEVVGGICCGLALFAASVFQQIGIGYTTPGVSAFITTNYVVAVPLLGMLLGRAPRRFVWAGAGLAVAGTYLICMTGRVPAGWGELLTLICAVLFGVHIMTVDRWVKKADVLAMTCVQFAAAAAAGAPFMALPGEAAMLTAENLAAGIWAIAFCGVMSSGVAYTLQNVGQAMVKPAPAAILLSLESVFGALFGWAFLGDALTVRQLAGCALVFGAVTFTQLMEMHAASGVRLRLGVRALGLKVFSSQQPAANNQSQQASSCRKMKGKGGER